MSLRLVAVFGGVLLLITARGSATVVLDEDFDDGVMPPGFAVLYGEVAVEPYGDGYALHFGSFHSCVQIPDQYSRDGDLVIEVDGMMPYGWFSDFFLGFYDETTTLCDFINGYRAALYPLESDNPDYRLDEYVGGQGALLDSHPSEITAGQPFHAVYQFLANGTIRVYVDGNLALEALDGSFSSGVLGLRAFDVAWADNLRVCVGPGAVTECPSGAMWHFDEGLGTIAHDALIGNDGTISGAVWTMGMSGSALAFWNGTTTSVSIPRSVFEGFGNTAYVEAWVYPTGLPSIAGTIFRKRAAFNDWSLYQLPDGRFRVDIFGYTGVGGVNGWNGLSIESPDALPLFTWSKLSSSYDGNTLTLSFDGVAVASATLSLPLMWFTPECPDDTYYEDGCYYGTWIGSVSTYSRTQVDPNYTFSGVIDEVIVRPLWLPGIFSDGFESGDTSAWSVTVP